MSIFFRSLYVAFLIALPGISWAQEQLVVGNFSGYSPKVESPYHWGDLYFKSVPNHTVYSPVLDEDTWVIQAKSNASSSALIRRINIDSERHPIVSFRWKIQDVIESADLRNKNTDDAPARIYITFAYDSTKVTWWETLKFEAIKIYYGKYPPIASLVYVWATHGQQDEIIESPYTDRIKIITLETGTENRNKWLSEKRDVRADYYAAFGSSDVPLISGVGIMTDSDNTEKQAVAWYGDIVFSAR